MKRLLRNLPRNNKGAALVEYALLLSVVSLCVKIGIVSYTNSLAGDFSYIACEIENPDTLVGTNNSPILTPTGKPLDKRAGGSMCTHNIKDNNYGTSSKPSGITTP